MLRFEMPHLKAPAKEHRRRIAQELEEKIQELSQSFLQATGHRGSPILEDAHRLMRRGGSLPGGGDYDLVLISDLLQTSPSFIFTADVLADVPSLEERVLKSLSPPQQPPRKVEILFWPGIVEGRRVLSPQAEMNLREFYVSLFTRWGAPQVALRELKLKEEGHES
jgi:hypothetical protein